MQSGSLSAGKARNKRAQWRRWIKRLHEELTTVVIAKHIFQEVGRIVRANPQIQTPGDFHDWLTQNYIIATSIRIRRLTDNRPDSVSLRRLLEEIKANSEALTRRSHKALYSAQSRNLADACFDRDAAPRKLTIPKKVLARDISQLRSAERRLRRLTNKQIAHLDARNRRIKPQTFHDVHSIIDLLEKTFLRYERLLTGQGNIQLLPVWAYEWQEIFRRPWIQ